MNLTGDKSRRRPNPDFRAHDWARRGTPARVTRDRIGVYRDREYEFACEFGAGDDVDDYESQQRSFALNTSRPATVRRRLSRPRLAAMTLYVVGTPDHTSQPLTPPPRLSA